MKKFNTFRQFKKVVRKYWKRHAIKSKIIHEGKKITCFDIPIEPWCFYIVNTEEELRKEYVKKWLLYEVENLKVDEFIETCISSLNKKIKPFADQGDKLFLGIVLTNNGALYAIQDIETRKCNVYPIYIRLNTIEENSDILTWIPQKD